MKARQPRICGQQQHTGLQLLTDLHRAGEYSMLTSQNWVMGQGAFTGSDTKYGDY